MPSERALEAEQLARAFVEAMRTEVEASYWAEAERVPLGGAPKAGAEGYALPNGCIVVVYRANVEEDFWRGEDTEWEALRDRLGDREYAHLTVFYPGQEVGDEQLRAQAAEDCKRALARRLWEPLIAQSLKETRDVRDRLKELFTSNPWLEKTLSAASGRLAAAEDRLASLQAVRAEQERALPYDDLEDTLERAERFAPEEGGKRLERINAHTAELFAREFVKTYRKKVEAHSPAPRAQPPFYRSYPYRIAAHILPNRCLILTFRHSADSPGFESAEADYEKAAQLLDAPGGAFVVALDNDARLESAEAKYLAERVADRTVAEARAASDAKEIASMLAEAEKDIQSAGKANPWLGPQASKLTESLARGRNGLERVHGDIEGQMENGTTLYNEVVRGDPAVAPHAHLGLRPVPGAAQGAAPAAGPSGAGEVVAMGSMSGATRAAEPQVANTPEMASHVFQEVSYYDFPQSDTVRELESTTDLGLPAADLIRGEALPPGAADLDAKTAEIESRVGELERRMFYMERYTEMIQEKHLEQTKKLRELMQVEGKRNRSRSVGLALTALLVGLFALIPVWPQTLDAIRAFFASIGLG
jgi:hypothetical protein